MDTGCPCLFQNATTRRCVCSDPTRWWRCAGQRPRSEAASQWRSAAPVSVCLQPISLSLQRNKFLLLRSAERVAFRTIRSMKPSCLPADQRPETRGGWGREAGEGGVIFTNSLQQFKAAVERLCRSHTLAFLPALLLLIKTELLSALRSLILFHLTSFLSSRHHFSPLWLLPHQKTKRSSTGLGDGQRSAAH